MCDITGLSKMLKLEDLMSTGETGQNIPSLLKPNSYDGFFFFFLDRAIGNKQRPRTTLSRVAVHHLKYRFVTLSDSK